LITAGVEGGIEIEDPRTGKVHSVFPLDKFLDGDRVDHLDVDKLHLSPDRKTVLAYVKPLFEHPPLVVELRIDNGASTVRKQTTHTFQGFSELKGKKETKYCAPCAFVRSGSLAIVDDDRGFSCWDYRTDSKWFLNEGDPASLEARVLVTPETQSIVYYGEQIRIVERFSGKDRLRIPLTSISDKVWQDVAIQGRLLAMTRPGGEIEFYDRFTGQRLGNLKAYPVTITSLAFHPAGQILAAGYADGAVIQWDLKDIIPNPKAERRSSEALEELWERLRHPDARTAYRATAELLDTKDVVGFLAGKVSPASEKEFIRLLKHLDSDQFATREKAFDELQRKFLLMRSHLERVELESLSPQQREFVSSLKPSVIDDRDALRTLRVLEILEFLGGEDAKRVLKKVASGDPHHLLTLEAKNAIQRLNGK
jgi:WD40 repeat protein